MSKSDTPQYPATPRNILKNYGLAVNEIKLTRALKNMTDTINNLEANSPESSRIKLLNSEAEKLQQQIDVTRKRRNVG
jgi:hypothetical protein